MTFQEYLVSIFFLVNKDLKTLASYVSKRQWQEVLLLSVLSFREELDRTKLIIEMSEYIHFLVADDKTIQYLLTIISKKYLSLKIPRWYHPTAIRALYLDMTRFVNCATDIDIINAGIEQSFLLAYEIDQELVTGLVLAIEIGRTRHSYRNIELVFDIGFTQMLVEAYRFGDNLEVCLDLFHDYIDDATNFNSEIGNKLKLLQQEFKECSKELTCKKIVDKLQNLMVETRNFGHNLQLSSEQKKLIQVYYDANKILVKCLNSGCKLSEQLRAEIEETLLLPIVEIEKRKREQKTE
ncbi:MAG: hypothetical protein HC785_08200 [Calothrix sp. CSU_2_0]|nr:hypothetical protein [Calothrix sp. CSU_2_0]